MLVLTRKKEESVILVHGKLRIDVKVLEIRGDKIRLGFEAPKDVVIHREEVFEEIAREKQR